MPIAEVLCEECCTYLPEDIAETCHLDGAKLCGPCHGNRDYMDECECGDAGHSPAPHPLL